MSKSKQKRDAKLAKGKQAIASRPYKSRKSRTGLLGVGGPVHGSF